VGRYFFGYKTPDVLITADRTAASPPLALSRIKIDVAMNAAEKMEHWDFLNKQQKLRQEKYKAKSPAKDLSKIEEWGPVLWESFHNKTREPIENTGAHRKWFLDFAMWIPCATCRLHYIQLLHKIPFNFNSQDSLCRWGVELHNAVNINLGKPIFPFDKNA
jgi:hypothetical protein